MQLNHFVSIFESQVKSYEDADAYGTDNGAGVTVTSDQLPQFKHDTMLLTCALRSATEGCTCHTVYCVGWHLAQHLPLMCLHIVTLVVDVINPIKCC